MRETNHMLSDTIDMIEAHAKYCLLCQPWQPCALRKKMDDLADSLTKNGSNLQGHELNTREKAGPS